MLKRVVESYSHFLVVDLEATCDDRGRVPKHEMEAIEFGSVLVSRETLEPEGEFATFIRPVRHPELTPFCIELTTINQSDVANAPLFPEAMVALEQWLGRIRPLFCSWGNYDKHQLAQDAAHHGIAVPLGAAHMNIKAAFSESLILKKKLGMAQALERVGLPLEGTHHRGIDDARNIARLLPWALGRN